MFMYVSKHSFQISLSKSTSKLCKSKKVSPDSILEKNLALSRLGTRILKIFKYLYLEGMAPCS